MPLTPSPEPAWIVGPVTWDLVGDDAVPGGTVLYAARSCEAQGVTAHVLTAGGQDASGEALVAHTCVRMDSATLTLRHDFATGRREQRLVQASGRTLDPDDVPAEWPEPITLILAPLLPEDLDLVAFVDEYPQAEVAVLAQGLQRAVLPDGRVAHRAQPSSALLDAARPNVSIFLSEEETALWPAGAIQHLVARAARVIVTRGAGGAELHDRAGTRRIEAIPARVVDSTGAGDVFAAAFILALRAGEAFAGRLAAACAAAAVEVRGPAALPTLADLEARLAAGKPIDGGVSA